MRFLSSAELLSAWEIGENQCPTAQALALLRAAFPDSDEDLMRMNIGRRDTKLLMLRQHLFGSRLVALSKCPACDEPMEAELTIGDLVTETPTAASDTLSIGANGREIKFRLPNSLDLLALSPGTHSGEACQQVLARCIMQSEREETLTHEEFEAISRAMGEADPQADTQLDLSCPACNHCWAEDFDIVGFLWSEVKAWAMRLLHEIHELASAYHWSETEILSLSPRRRQAYLDLIRQ